jgi:hypothetical protein
MLWNFSIHLIRVLNRFYKHILFHDVFRYLKTKKNYLENKNW